MESTGEECCQAGVVNQVKEADLPPRSGRPSEDGAGFSVVAELPGRLSENVEWLGQTKLSPIFFYL